MTRAVCVALTTQVLVVSVETSQIPIYIGAFPVQRLTPAGVSCFLHLMSQVARRHTGIYLTNVERFRHPAECSDAS